MIKLTDKKFHKLNEKEVADFVEKMKSQLGGGKGEA